MDAHHSHAAMISTRGTGGQAGVDKAQVTQVSSFKESMKLNDPGFLDIVPEPWWAGPSALMMTLFPSVIFQQLDTDYASAVDPGDHITGRFRGVDELSLTIGAAE